MGFMELETSLTDEQKTIRAEARKFFMKVWRPASIKLDKLADPRDVIAEGSIFWNVLRETYRLGYHKMAYPKELGGLELDPLTRLLISEEMGYASSDFAITLGCCGFPYTFAGMSTSPEVQNWVRQFVEDTEAKMTGCWAITEPDHGSDWLVGKKDDPKIAPQVVVIPDVNGYVINGQKSSWVSNGTIASHAALFFTFNRAKGMQANGIAVLPLNLPGISRGKPLNKIGQRALNQGEIFFDNVRIPREYVVVTDPVIYRWIADATLTGANAGMGVTFTGLAQAALDEALAYAKTRIQGGSPIIEHQNIQGQLFEMFKLVEAARAFSRRISLYANPNAPPPLPYAIACKAFCTEAAFNVASMAMQIFGGAGVSKDFVIEKLLRDARISMIEDGVN